MCLTIERIILSSLSLSDEAFNPKKGHTDVIVQMTGGARYVASFFAFDSIGPITADLRRKGENLGGNYFWAPNMILVDECSKTKIEEVVEQLIEEGDFTQLFAEI